MASQHPDDAHYRATLAHLSRPEPPAPLWWKLLLLLLILAPAAAAMLVPEVGLAVLLLLPVLLLHELGHRAAMRILGFRDGRLFFLPFADAGLPPSRGPVPALHRGLALMAGPLPGLVLAVALQVTLHPTAGSLTGTLVGWLVLFNGANLLPLGAFDSGRLVESMLVHRRRLLAAGAWLATAAALLGAAWLLSSSVLALVAASLLLAPVMFYPLLRAGPPPELGLPPHVQQMNDGQRRSLHAMAHEDDPEATAAAMRLLHERLTEPAPTQRGWLMLGALHFLGVLLAFAAAAMLAHDTARATRSSIDALVARFDAYQEKRDGTSWADMLETWRQAPPAIQKKAVSVLLLRDFSDPRRRRDITRLSRELSVPMTLE